MKEKLTFERIRKECEPMKYLLVNNNGSKYLYIGFNRCGKLVTDSPLGHEAIDRQEHEVENWTIEPYEPPKEKKRYWLWRVNNGHYVKWAIYMDDDGIRTDGIKYFQDWEDLEKQKIEDDYIDV